MSRIINLPTGWKRKRLEKVAIIQTGIAKNQNSKEECIELPYLRVANVQDGYLDLSEIKTINIHKDKVNRYRLESGDVLLTEGGDFDKLGRGAVWEGQIPNCLHQNHVFAVRSNNHELLSSFLSAQTGSSYGKKYFLSCSKQSTNLASINSSQLKAFPVLLPPLSEQKAIADLLSTWDEGIEKTEKTPIDALMAFANLSQGMRISEMQDSAIKQLKQHPLSSLFGGTYMSRDGRVIAKTNGINFDDTPDGNHPNVQATVMRNHGIHLTLIVQGNILPALEILHLEHRIREVDFLSIVKQSPIVPPGREVLFAKGLYSGYDHDYVTALHLLSPQIENLVRYHLKNAGAKTSTLDSCGIENENGLSTLVALPEMKAVFGDDLTFEIKALFCDPLGANLRNELAHGLIDHNACNSLHGVYAWWLTLKLVFNTFWNVARQERESENTEGERYE